ncbi:MAG: tetratricopeptide repeat protein [bacterium]
MPVGSTPEKKTESKKRSPEIRVFISSTFRDMQDEREYIIKHVFPELRTICRERGVEFTEIDLRWGVTAEEAEQGKVLKICLDEIDRCRPYFIGILGERYGWVPNVDDVKKDPELVTEHPWVIPCINDGISVTEMEMLYGVLHNPAMADHAYFYFRDEKNTRPEFRETDPATAGKLAALKDRIRESSFPVRENFPSPANIGALIREDLLNVINNNFPLDEAPSPLEQKRLVQDAYARTIRKAYIPRSSYIQKLDSHVTDEGPQLILTGESGSGKSALMAYWANEFIKNNPDAFVIHHFIGAGSSDTGHLDIIRRVMEEIRERYSIEDEIPTIPESLEQDFSSWIAKVQKEKLILIIDSLDRLSEKSALLHWLPNYFPPNIRVFLSTGGGDTLDILRKRDSEILTIEPLTEEESDKLIVRYLSQYRKALSNEQRKAITSDSKSTNPLFLRTVLEELRIFGSFEELNNRISHYMGSRDMSDLFQRMLARMEHDYGAEGLDQVLSLIWASRRGLAETEIMEIAGVTRLELSPLVHALEEQLIRRTGLLNFYHSYLRSAVEERYFQPKMEILHPSTPHDHAHLQIAEYFKKQPISPRKADELPWHFAEAGRTDELQLAISEIPMFLEFAKDDKQFELLGYWRKIGDLSLMEKAYDDNVARAEEEIANDKGLMYDLLAGFFKESGRNVLTEKYFENAVRLRTIEFGEGSDEAEESRFHLASLKWWIQGDYAAAESLFTKSLKFNESKYGRRDPHTAKILYYLGTLEQLQAHYPQAESLFKESVEIIESRRGPQHPELAPAVNKLACLYLETGDYSSAEPLFVKAFRICESAFGKDHPTTIEAYQNLAELYNKKGDHKYAEECYRNAIIKWENIFGKEHPSTIVALNNLATTFLNNGELSQAKESFLEVLEIEIKVFGSDNFHTAGTQNNLAETLDALGEYEDAEMYYIASLRTLEKIFGDGHPITAHPIQGLGQLWLNKENPAIAAEYFEQAFEIRNTTLGSHPETLQSLESYFDIVSKFGSEEKKIELGSKLLTLREAITSTQHP